MIGHKQSLPRITTKEKTAPAYIKKIEEENIQLKKSLETTQDQASILQQRCINLEKDNSVLSERLSGSGLQTTAKDLFFLIGGAGISSLVACNYFIAALLLSIAFVCMTIYLITTNFQKNKLT